MLPSSTGTSLNTYEGRAARDWPSADTLRWDEDLMQEFRRHYRPPGPRKAGSPITTGSVDKTDAHKENQVMGKHRGQAERLCDDSRAEETPCGTVALGNCASDENTRKTTERRRLKHALSVLSSVVPVDSSRLERRHSCKPAMLGEEATIQMQLSEKKTENTLLQQFDRQCDEAGASFNEDGIPSVVYVIRICALPPKPSKKTLARRMSNGLKNSFRWKKADKIKLSLQDEETYRETLVDL